MKSTSLLIALTALSAQAPAEDWPGWRGPDGLGVSRETGLPWRWSATENIAWKTPVPGQGTSSPAIAGDRVHLTSQGEDTGLRVLAFDRASGRLLWDREIAKGTGKAHQLHNMATPTPAADAAHVWALFGTGDLACLDREGNIVWQRNLQKDHGAYNILWGMGTSPMLHHGRLFIACMHQGPSYLLAVDAKTGKDLWKADRNLGAKDESPDSYSSPVFLRDKGRTQVVLAGADHVTAHDAQTGEQLWISGGLAVPHKAGRTISGPAAGDGVVVAVASGFQNRGWLLAVRGGGRGDVTASHRQWEARRNAPDCPTPVVYQDMVFLIRDDGIASCLDLKTGQAHWSERLFAANVKVSPVAGDGRVYFMSGTGETKVLRAGAKFEVLAENPLGEETLCSPALSQGKMFVRTRGHLWAIEK